MKVFLTGGTGFIGGRIAERLRERGDEVSALVRSLGKAEELEAAGCHLFPGDLSDLASIRAGMEGCTAVITRRRCTRWGSGQRTGRRCERRTSTGPPTC